MLLNHQIHDLGGWDDRQMLLDNGNHLNKVSWDLGPPVNDKNGGAKRDIENTPKYNCPNLVIKTCYGAYEIFLLCHFLKWSISDYPDSD